MMDFKGLLDLVENQGKEIERQRKIIDALVAIAAGGSTYGLEKYGETLLARSMVELAVKYGGDNGETRFASAHRTLLLAVEGKTE